MFLGIESSCDETSVAVLKSNGEVVLHEIYTQSIHHQDFRGVVPEIASREHFNKLPELLKPALPYLHQLQAVCATNEPGLLGPLLVGLTAGKTLSYILGIPFIPVNHLHAHMISPLMENHLLKFPFVSVLLSGGHSQIAIVKSVSEFQVICKTVDDACGEAFDKGAMSLNFDYPGVKKLDQLADQGETKFRFNPSFRQEKKNCNFSFSGHKTEFRKLIANNPDAAVEDLCASYREALVNEVCHKVERVLTNYPETKRLPWSLSGGVAANAYLRVRMRALTGELYVPRLEFCTDNAAMIAFLGKLKFENGARSDLHVDARPS